MRSPKILNMNWGEIETEAGTFRDAKLWPGGGRNWDWNETGTSHTPGIQIADVEELVENGAQIIILSQGQNGRLQTKDETIDYLKENGITFEIMNTNDAIEKYNEIAQQNENVGTLIHSTC